MKKNYFLIIAMLVTTLSFGQLTINEIYYADANDFVELKGPVNYNLSGWTLELYAPNSNPLGAINLSAILGGTMPSLPNYSGVTFQDWNLPQNISATGGYALLKENGVVIDFIAFGDATEKVVSGVTSTYAGIAGTGNSLQLTDAGWVSATPTSPGDQNAGQALSVTNNQIVGFAMYPNPVSNGKLSISSNSSVEKLVEIYNMIGQKVYNKIVKANESIDISGLNTGFYVVKAEEEGKVATRKLIVN